MKKTCPVEGCHGNGLGVVEGKEGGRLQGTWRCIPGLDHCGGKTLGSGAAAEAPQREEPNQKMCFSIALAKNYADGEECTPHSTWRRIINAIILLYSF